MHPNPVQQKSFLFGDITIQPSQRSPGFLMVKLWNELPFIAEDFTSFCNFSSALSNFDWKNSHLCCQLFSRYSRFFLNPDVLGFQSRGSQMVRVWRLLLLLIWRYPNESKNYPLHAAFVAENPFAGTLVKTKATWTGGSGALLTLPQTVG